MGSTYAGILGLLAFSVELLRAALQGSSASSAFPSAAAMMFAFAGLGYVLGRIAESTIEDAVRLQFRQAMAELAAAEANSAPPAERSAA